MMRYEILVDSSGAVHSEKPLPPWLSPGPDPQRAAFEGALLIVTDINYVVTASHIEAGPIDLITEIDEDSGDKWVRYDHGQLALARTLTVAELRLICGPGAPLAVFDETLDRVKQRMKTRLDIAAEAERMKYITSGTGQALTYKEKAAEAVRFASTNGAGTYPFLDAMVSAGRVADRAAAAALVLQQESAWTAVGAAIEAKREKAKVEIDKAATVEQAAAAARVVW